MTYWILAGNNTHGRTELGYPLWRWVEHRGVAHQHRLATRAGNTLTLTAAVHVQSLSELRLATTCRRRKPTCAPPHTQTAAACPHNHTARTALRGRTTLTRLELGSEMHPLSADQAARHHQQHQGLLPLLPRLAASCHQRRLPRLQGHPPSSDHPSRHHQPPAPCRHRQQQR